jgi:Protein of unknown function (DUF1501)
MMTQASYSFDRRHFLRVGAGGVVGSVIPFRQHTTRGADAEAEPGFGRAKSVLIVLLSGGLSQLDTLDPKPNAPAEVRGEFSTIGTTIPGVAVCEHLPKLAQQTDRWSIVRTLAHAEHNHLLAMHVALTGRPTPLPRGGTDLDRVESRSDFPNFGAALGFVRPRNDGIPSGVSLPNYMIEGPLTWPGQHAGFLGSRFDPWQIKGDPNDADFRMDSLSLQDDMSMSRFDSRRQLLDALNSGPSSLPGSRDAAEFREQQELACSLLTSGRMTEAFALNKEPDAVRDRYGRHKFGQSLLLARRLLEAGVPMVQATMGIVQTWDTHVDNWGRLKSTLLPPLDQGLAALMDDLAATGKLDETFVIVMSEFGRTPKISTLPGSTIPGRDHWAHTYSGLFAGAGVRGGQVVGQTDASAAYPVTKGWSPADICTTLFSALGVRHETILKDPLGRPHHLMNGNVIAPLYDGRSA